MSADLIVENARVLTMDPGRPRAEAVAVRGGRIRAIGPHLAADARRVIDADGLALMPGIDRREGRRVEAIERRIRGLTDLLHAELSKTSARLTSSRDPAARSGITVFQYRATPAEDRALVEEILRQKVYISIRYTSNIGGIRVSTHFYNNDEDVHRFVQTLKRIAG